MCILIFFNYYLESFLAAELHAAGVNCLNMPVSGNCLDEMNHTNQYLEANEATNKRRVPVDPCVEKIRQGEAFKLFHFHLNPSFRLVYQGQDFMPEAS